MQRNICWLFLVTGLNYIYLFPALIYKTVVFWSWCFEPHTKIQFLFDMYAEQMFICVLLEHGSLSLSTTVPNKSLRLLLKAIQVCLWVNLVSMSLSPPKVTIPLHPGLFWLHRGLSICQWKHSALCNQFLWLTDDCQILQITFQTTFCLSISWFSCND